MPCLGDQNLMFRIQSSRLRFAKSGRPAFALLSRAGPPSLRCRRENKVREKWLKRDGKDVENEVQNEIEIEMCCL